MPSWTKFWLDVRNEGSDDGILNMEMQLDQ